MAAILAFYRRIPALPAFVLATLVAAIAAVAIAVAGVFAISKVLDHLGQSGPGAGVLVITAIPNIILPFFIFALTLLMHLHGRASWKTPPFAFVVGAVATWMWIGPFDAVFAPVVLGTGILAWGISCFMFRRKRLRVIPPYTPSRECNCPVLSNRWANRMLRNGRSFAELQWPCRAKRKRALR